MAASFWALEKRKTGQGEHRKESWKVKMCRVITHT